MLDDGNGLVRRRPVRRTPAERTAIVAETYQPGATVSGVAQRHGIVASQLSSWRTVEKVKAELRGSSDLRVSDRRSHHFPHHHLLYDPRYLVGCLCERGAVEMGVALGGAGAGMAKELARCGQTFT